MTILAIDPGDKQSAWCTYDVAERRLISFGKGDNEHLLEHDAMRLNHMAIEMIASYGMPVGREVFETCVWIGRFIEAFGGTSDSTLVYRRDVKLHLTGSPRAKDANIRQALLDRYGGKQTAVGTKRAPGPLYGVKADVWSALAIAVTYSETCASGAPIDSDVSRSVSR